MTIDDHQIISDYEQYNSLGLNLEIEHRYETAMDMYSKAYPLGLQLSKAHPIQYGRSFAAMCYCYGMLLTQHGDTELATEVFNNAILSLNSIPDNHRHVSDNDGIALLFYYLAKIKMAKGEYEESERLYWKAYDILDQEKDVKPCLADVCYDFAHLLSYQRGQTAMQLAKHLRQKADRIDSTNDCLQ